jgi:hypothetical protein
MLVGEICKFSFVIYVSVDKKSPLAEDAKVASLSCEGLSNNTRIDQEVMRY